MPTKSSKPNMESLSLSGNFQPNSGEALFYAAAYGQTRKVKDIITKNPRAINYRNSARQMPLHIAAYRGHTDAVIALVDADAPLEAKDEDGDTPLICAIAGNRPDNPDICKYLINSGSDVNATNNKGHTPLHFAAANGNPGQADMPPSEKKRKTCWFL